MSTHMIRETTTMVATAQCVTCGRIDNSFDNETEALGSAIEHVQDRKYQHGENHMVRVAHYTLSEVGYREAD